jgi:poly(beta-D-mannuronate) lyase
MKTTLLCLACLFAGFVSSLSARTFIIGIHDEPDEELSDLKGTLLPGDEIIIANGTYTDQALKFIGIGTEQEPIVMRAETPGGVLLNGTSYVQFDGSHLQVEGLLWYNGDDYLRKTNSRAVEFRGSVNGHAHYCRLTNCAIIDYNYQFLDTSDSDKDGNTEEYLWAHSKKWIEIFGTHNRVDHCYFYNKRTEASLIVVELRQDSDWLDEDPSRTEETPQYETIRHRIDHNYFGDIQLGRPDRSDNNEAIRVGTSTYSNFNAEVVVENNFFYACDAEIETISNKSQNNIYRNNVLYRCLGGIVMRHGDGALIANNIILGDGRANNAGIRLNGQDHIVVGNYISGITGSGMRAGFTMRNAGSITGDDSGGGYEQARFNTIAYNTIIDCNEPINLGSSGSSNNNFKPVSNTIVNNIIASANASEAIVTSLSTSEFAAAVDTWGGNLFWARTLGIPEQEGVTFADPNMEQRADSLWTLSASSLGRNAAVGGFESLGTDLDGEVIEAPSSDSGADQFSEARTLIAQLDLTGVGPDWATGQAPSTIATTALAGSKLRLKVPITFPFLLSDYGLWHSRALTAGCWYPMPVELESTSEGTATFRITTPAEGYYRFGN